MADESGRPVFKYSADMIPNKAERGLEIIFEKLVLQEKKTTTTVKPTKDKKK